METSLKTIIWLQFGAAIDTLDTALHACPDELWRERMWEDPEDRPEYTEVWFIVYHTLSWLDRYLSAIEDSFTPMAGFSRDDLDLDRPFTKDQLQTYLAYGRQKCETTIAALTDETAQQPCYYSWIGDGLTFLELLLYTMRHVQDHAAHLNMFLGQHGIELNTWVSRAGNYA